MAALKKMFHPTLNVPPRHVPESQVESWVEAGWRKTPPKGFAPEQDSPPVVVAEPDADPADQPNPKPAEDAKPPKGR